MIAAGAPRARPTPPHQLPLARLPVVPRPRRHEPGGSYLIRLAAANAMDPARLTRLLGPRRLHLSRWDNVALNRPALHRLAALTGRSPTQLLQAIPGLHGYGAADGPPGLSTYRTWPRLDDCPDCRLRRGDIPTDTTRTPLKLACVPHRRWLVADDHNEVARDARWVLPAVRRLGKLSRRFGESTVAAGYQLARRLLHEWEPRRRPTPTMWSRYHDRAIQIGHPHPSSYRFPWKWPEWHQLPELLALTTLLSNPSWAQAAQPTPDRTHRRFYAHLARRLDLRHRDGQPLVVDTVLSFLPLPELVLYATHRGVLVTDLDDSDIDLASCRLLDPRPELPADFDITDDHPDTTSYRRWYQLQQRP
jgi:hypothetical protein